MIRRRRSNARGPRQPGRRRSRRYPASAVTGSSASKKRVQGEVRKIMHTLLLTASS